MHHWHDRLPIYQQLKEQLIQQILEGDLAENTAIPSIRQISAEYKLNPLTVAKAYQALVEIKVLEKRRGLGMFVAHGARQHLFLLEKEQFLQHQWPAIYAKIQRLGLHLEELLA